MPAAVVRCALEVAMYVFLFSLLACVSENPAEVSDPAAQTEQAEQVEQTARAALVSALDECKADSDCMASLVADDDLLGNCPWYEAVGCSAAVAAAGAACVVTEGEACLEALEAVKAIGCCDCLPKGKVRDMCKEL